MANLPVITGFGGINAAGRSSFHHGFHRLVLDQLSSDASIATLTSLAGLMQIANPNPDDPAQILQWKERICAHTLIRKTCFSNHFIDPAVMHQPVHVVQQSGATGIRLYVPKYRLSSIPKQQYRIVDNIVDTWSTSAAENNKHADHVLIEINQQDNALFLACQQEQKVQASAQLPNGFVPDKLYAARNHPKALQMALFGVSDAIHASGVDLDWIKTRVRPNEIAVYVSNSTGQIDAYSLTGVLKSALTGKRVNSKQLPLSYPQMPADFINAYVLGNVGKTGGSVGACATFLYNLSQAVADITSGRSRFVIVGTVDAPIQPEIIESFRIMGALVEDSSLRQLDGLNDEDSIDYSKASRPFGNNGGFVLAEASQFIILMDDQLAMEAGAHIYGAVPAVHIHADGYKHSITSPGIGNYLTMAQSCATLRALLGTKPLQQQTCVLAHGTSTPQNRTTESHILSSMADIFGIQNWPIIAVKSLLGHSQGSAAGDQIMTALGIWGSGYFPGIKSIAGLAEDVSTAGLDFILQDRAIDANQLCAALINAKGFGGNNASAVLLAPHITRKMLLKRHGKNKVSTYYSKHEPVQQKAAVYDTHASRGKFDVIYHFGKKLTDAKDITLTRDHIKVHGFRLPINLKQSSIYQDMLDEDV